MHKNIVYKVLFAAALICVGMACPSPAFAQQETVKVPISQNLEDRSSANHAGPVGFTYKLIAQTPGAPGPENLSALAGKRVSDGWTFQLDGTIQADLEFSFPKGYADYTYKLVPVLEGQPAGVKRSTTEYIVHIRTYGSDKSAIVIVYKGKQEEALKSPEITWDVVYEPVEQPAVEQPGKDTSRGSGLTSKTGDLLYGVLPVAAAMFAGGLIFVVAGRIKKASRSR